MLKRRYGLCGLLLTIFVLITSISVVAQPVYWPELFNRSHGKIWWFSTNDPMTGDTMFSGTYVDETSIVAQYYIVDGSGNEVYTTIVPKEIGLSEHKVTLYFDPVDLPDYADGTRVTGKLKKGLEFLATGPGFMWWKRG